jgi:hypothetical protein
LLDGVILAPFEGILEKTVPAGIIRNNKISTYEIIQVKEKKFL